jgi:hypothetical protein
MSVEPKIEERKMVYCSISLFNIAKDLFEICPEISKTCFDLSKALVEKVKNIEIPEAVVHSETSTHNTNVGPEVEAIIKEIQAKK